MSSLFDIDDDFDPDDFEIESPSKSQKLEDDKTNELSRFDKARIERNRQKAILLRQGRVSSRPNKK